MTLKQRKTIFLVDDDLTNLNVGKNALSGHYNVFTLNSSALLLKILEKNIPDLILLDVEMPEINGYETMKILKSKERTKNIPVIFLTAKSDYDNELEGLLLGAVDYIKKPFSPILLLKRLEMHLELIALNTNLQEMVELRTQTILELQSAILATMAELVECRDDVTGGHIERTQNYMYLMLKALFDAPEEKHGYRNEISLWDTKVLLQSAQLHDVGKIIVSDNILNKPGKLTKEEFDKMKEHTTFGEKVIEKIEKNIVESEFLKHAKIFAASHHEKWDGSGYPKGIKGEEIPLQGRIMAIADVYDALISDRPYKKAFSHEEAVGIIVSGRGKHFDPVLVDLFVEIADKFAQISQSNRI